MGPNIDGFSKLLQGAVMLTENFIEFCKVLSVVFGTSCMIFSIKKVVVDLEHTEEKDDKQEDTPSAKVIPIRNNPDFIDYDGMGNQGRFMTRKKK
tara:strand:- start:115 stop:399 length:285 start_codon:yes stop_codon:yes gene_type:complete